jgi:hypothetical protein
MEKLIQRLDQPLQAVYDDRQVDKISKRQALIQKIKR